jgi:hypothetical protein
LCKEIDQNQNPARVSPIFFGVSWGGGEFKNTTQNFLKAHIEFVFAKQIDKNPMPFLGVSR